jgi:hypothetical protein
VVAIDPACWPPPAAPLAVAGRVLAPKHELHVTVIGKALGLRLQAAVAEDAVRAAFCAQRWRLRRSGWRLRLRREAQEAVIEPVALPAMARFHARLGRLLGEPLPVPPPHVTLFVCGDAEGIGVPDAATLAALRVGEPWRER